MARERISIRRYVQRPIVNIQYSRKQRGFGVLLGMVLVTLAGYAVYKYPPTLILEFLVLTALFFGMVMVGGWSSGRRKWGWFSALMILTLPILNRVELLNPVTVAIWLLVLGLTALIN